MPINKRLKKKVAVLRKDIIDYEEQLGKAVDAEDIPAAKRLREPIAKTEQLIDELMEEQHDGT